MKYRQTTKSILLLSVFVLGGPFACAEVGDGENGEGSIELANHLVRSALASSALAHGRDVVRDAKGKPIPQLFGFYVQEGKFDPFTVASCESLPTCYGSNPSSPYGIFKLPPGPGEQNPIDLEDTGLAQDWRLRSDEAILYLGRTPPEAKYFSFTPYLFSRTAADGSRKTLFGSMADSLNQFDFDSLPRGAFNEEIALLITADGATETKVAGILEQLGVPASRVYKLHFPGQLLVSGLQDNADTLATIFRVASFTHEKLGDAFLNSAGTVLRLTPTTASTDTSQLFPKPVLKSRVTANLETPLAPSLANLVAAVRALTDGPGRLAQPVAVSPFPIDNGFQCIPALSNCQGDTRDAAYNFTSATLLLSNDPNDFFYVFGALHEFTGMATYTGVAVTNIPKSAGLDGLLGDQLQHSADAYLPEGDPGRGKLYVVKVARSCAPDDAYCIPVASTGWPSVGLTEPLRLIERAYLNTTLTVAPMPTGILRPQVIHYVPAP